MALNIALINMPFGFHIYPSIQLGTLSTILKSNGWSIDNFVKTSFEGPPAWIIVFCNESPKTIDQIKKHVLELGAEGENAAEDAISQLEKMGILYGEKGKFLTLALPHNANL